MDYFFFILFAVIAGGIAAAVVKTMRAWADARARTSAQSTRAIARTPSAREGFPYIA